MKRTLALTLALLMLCTALVGCGKKDTYTPGNVTDGVYTSEWMGIKYTTTDDMIVASQAEMAAISGSESNSDMTNELMVTTADGSNLMIMTQKLAISGMTEEQYIDLSKKDLDTAGMNVTFSDVKSATYAGKDFKTFDVTMAAQGISVYQKYLIAKKDSRIFGIIVTAMSEADIETLLAGLSAL